MAKILVVADIKNGVLKGSTAELLSKAKSLGAETAAVGIGSNIESLAGEIANAGSDTQYIADDASLELFQQAHLQLALSMQPTSSALI